MCFITLFYKVCVMRLLYLILFRCETKLNLHLGKYLYVMNVDLNTDTAKIKLFRWYPYFIFRRKI